MILEEEREGGGVEVGRGMEWSGELISGLGEGGDGSEK